MQLAKKAVTNNMQKLTETIHLHKNILLLIHVSIKKIWNETHANVQFMKKAVANNMQKLTETIHLYWNILPLHHASIKKFETKHMQSCHAITSINKKNQTWNKSFQHTCFVMQNASEECYEKRRALINISTGRKYHNYLTVHLMFFDQLL